MPTYEYRCPDGHQFDHFFRKISESQPTMPCPVCGRPAERLMSAGAGLLFKGSGFYITDYGKDGKKDRATAPKRDDAAEPGGDGAKKDTGAGATPSAEGAGTAGGGATPGAATSGGPAAGPSPASPAGDAKTPPPATPAPRRTSPKPR